MDARIKDTHDAPVPADDGHAARMDAFYRVHRHLYDVTRPFFLLGRRRTIRGLHPPPNGTILEIGCGTARNLIEAAGLQPDTRLFGIDISSEMLATAHASVSRHGLSERIELAQADAGAFDPADLFGVERFDRILFSYTLSMMPPWKEALRRAAAGLNPDGSIHVIDFGQHERLPAFVRRLHFRSINSHHVQARSDLREVMEALARPMGAEVEFQRLFRGYAWRVVLRIAN